MRFTDKEIDILLDAEEKRQLSEGEDIECDHGGMLYGFCAECGELAATRKINRRPTYTFGEA